MPTLKEIYDEYRESAEKLEYGQCSVCGAWKNGITHTVSEKACAEINRLTTQNTDLLEALKIALHRADQARHHTAETIEPITAEWLEGIISAARAAIAKAEGN